MNTKKKNYSDIALWSKQLIRKNTYSQHCNVMLSLDVLEYLSGYISTLVSGTLIYILEKLLHSVCV